MNKSIAFLLICLAAVTNLGCGSSSASTADDKALRAEYSKAHFSINDVPANERARVQGFMDRAKAMQAQGKSPGVGK